MKLQPSANARASTHQAIDDDDRADWARSSVEVWATESLDIARRPSVRYCVRAANKCRYEQNNEQLDKCEKQKTVTITAAYLTDHGPIVAERLKQAGVRLAHLINGTLGSRRTN